MAVEGEGAPLYRLAEVLEETGAEATLVKELEEYGVIKGERRDGEQFYDDTEKEIIRAVAELARFGVGGRNLRVFRTSADREAALLEQILAPALRSRNPERRREAVEALENLAADRVAPEVPAAGARPAPKKACARSREDNDIGAYEATYKRLLCGGVQHMDYVVGKEPVDENFEAARKGRTPIWHYEDQVGIDGSDLDDEFAEKVKDLCDCGEVARGR